MPYIVAVPTPNGVWRPLKWTPCGARPPLMARFSANGPWYRDGFDKEDPRAGTFEIGIALWFDKAPELAGLISVAEALELSWISLTMNFEEVERIADELVERGLAKITVERE